jgi:EAL domain-containing protein (putative c-di-GMP-specific phosphodiesterase class I)
MFGVFAFFRGLLERRRQQKAPRASGAEPTRPKDGAPEGLVPVSPQQDSASPVSISEAGWYLEELADGGQLRRSAIQTLPFRVGRERGLELVLRADSVSKYHAEIYTEGSALCLRDLHTTNGTFVNRSPVEDAPLREGDILHFADVEFRLGRAGGPGDSPVAPELDKPHTTVAVHRKDLPHGFAEGTRELRELLREEQVTVLFQPIVLLSQGTVAAYEALGRGRHPRLPGLPAELFRIAESIGVEAELSRLFRRKAVELAAPRTDLPTIFLNTHRLELKRPGLLESLEELRNIAPHLDLALEIHESLLTEPTAIAEVRALLLERNIAIAYDNFGTGQARLLELAEAPPHYLKFHQRFVSSLDQATAPRRRLLQSLLVLARDLQVKTVAEGIETPGEARACAEIGFTHAQGFHIGQPRTIQEI